MYIGQNRYKIREGDALNTNLVKNHRDPGVYVVNAESVKPERMLDEAFQKLPPRS
ncbi:hypothetical protein HO173_001330 [Letharia columbiana]|uniref:Uncharacterized protein n=1 Tax=Letharia columbiana TaxID=112416 RepID=A0A8H6G511_9LECA|nr:uncharacterized protein HO173_001330 [Letharia columbiana]KAF6240658.1 hypothetical protein HO173_001330 [Letharia columbiana]